MNVPRPPEPGAVEPSRPAADLMPPAAPRSRLRLATVGGIAAIAILGGGITAAASVGAPTAGGAVAAATGTASPPELTSRLVPTTTAAPGTNAPGTNAPGTNAPGTNAPVPPAADGPGNVTTPPAPPAARAHQPHLDGTVSSVSGSTVLIKDHEGFTRTILESSGTTYQDGLKAALGIGTKIHAEGTVASNGTSLDATVIGLDKGPAAGGPAGKGPAGNGPAGKGPGGKPAGPPSGAPQPPATGGANAPTPPSGANAPTPPSGTNAPTPPAGTTSPSTMATTK